MVKEISVEGRDKLRIVIEKKKDCELSAFMLSVAHTIEILGKMGIKINTATLDLGDQE
jgi:hypothetical protein